MNTAAGSSVSGWATIEDSLIYGLHRDAPVYGDR
jgi:hypothetical protein